MIFFLLLSKSIGRSSRILNRLFIYISTCLIAVAAMFFVLQLNGYTNQSNLFASVDILLPSLVLCTLALFLCGEAIRVTRKDLDAAEVVFEVWLKEKRRGKRQFIVKRFATVMIAVALLMASTAYITDSSGITPMSAITSGLLLVGIGWAIVLGIWHLNNKYQDDVGFLIERAREETFGASDS